MDTLRVQARKAALTGLMDKLERYSSREKYEMPFKISGGWGAFECYCQECAVAEVGEMHAIGIDDGPEDTEGDFYADKANVCQVCKKPLRFMLSYAGVAHELEEYRAAPPYEATPRLAYVLCAIMENMIEHVHDQDFESETYVEVVTFGKQLCDLIDSEPQLDLFPLTMS